MVLLRRTWNSTNRHSVQLFVQKWNHFELRTSGGLSISAKNECAFHSVLRCCGERTMNYNEWNSGSGFKYNKSTRLALGRTDTHTKLKFNWYFIFLRVFFFKPSIRWFCSCFIMELIIFKTIELCKVPQ